MKGLLLVALLGLLAGCASSAVRDAAALDPEGGRQILLTVHQDEDLALELRGATSTRYLTRRGYGPSPDVERTLNQLARQHGLTRVDGWLIASLDAYCEVLAVRESVDIDELLETLNDDPRVELAQRMNVFETQLGRYDDPYADLQESALDLEIAPAHELATGQGVTVAVIDSGVDTRHPELRRVAVSRNFVLGTHGGQSEIHGTAIAGIIASQVNNSEGIVGVAPNARVVALRACWAVAAASPTAHCSTFTLALALETAMDLGARVINMSLSGPSDALLGELLDEALERGITIVAAGAESASSSDDAFPASHAGVFVAEGAAGDAALAPRALAAPAKEILTTTPGAGYAFLSGNSLAAAHITGVVALLLERAPEIGSTELLSVLKDSTNDARQTRSISACRALAHVTGTGHCAELSSRTELHTTR
jgi:hypothetical protein